MTSKKRREHLEIADLITKDGKWKSPRDLTPEQRERAKAHLRDSTGLQAKIDHMKRSEPTLEVLRDRNRARREQVRELLKCVLVTPEPQTLPKEFGVLKRMWLIAVACLLPKGLHIVAIPAPSEQLEKVDAFALQRWIEDLWSTRDHSSKIDPEILRLDDVEDAGEDELIALPPSLADFVRGYRKLHCNSVDTPHHVDAEGEE